MTRRTLWTTLCVVLAVLAVASLGPRHGPTLLAWWQGVRVADLSVALPRVLASVSPTVGVVGGGIAGLLLFGLLLVWRRGRVRARDRAGEATAPFAAQLADAMRATVPHGGARRRAAEELVRAGVAIEEIARTTRLSRDAIRVIDAAIAAAERHELPPHSVAASSA
jgi:hypothetical protein